MVISGGLSIITLCMHTHIHTYILMHICTQINNNGINLKATKGKKLPVLSVAIIDVEGDLNVSAHHRVSWQGLPRAQCTYGFTR